MFRYSSRMLFAAVVIVALICGWFSTWQRADRQRKSHERQLRYATAELERARDQLRDLLRGNRPDLSRAFWESELDGSDLTGVTIASKVNAFQSASFRDCKLGKATLEGGDAAFQFASFDAANLAQASLTGGDSSFQYATFVGAELTAAKLTGGPASFQRSSFEDAIMVGAKLTGSFQVANLSGAKLEGADISAIACEDLISCYFSSPPSYNAATKFPAGFDPISQQWHRTE